MSPTGESSVKIATGGKFLKEQQLPNSDGWMLAHFQPFPPLSHCPTYQKKQEMLVVVYSPSRLRIMTAVPNLPESDLLALLHQINNKQTPSSLAAAHPCY